MENEILIVGPGSSIKTVKEFSFPEKMPVLAFSTDLKIYEQLEIIPDFWTFLDPNSIQLIYDNFINNRYNVEFLQSLKSKTILVYNSFQATEDFYKFKFTTPKGDSWVKNEFKEIIFPTVKSMFKGEVKLESEIYFDGFPVSKLESLRNRHAIIQHRNPCLNTDKFSTFLLPLIWHLFPEVKTVNSLGFGDYDQPRIYIDSVGDYEHYKSSFSIVKENLQNILQKMKIKINFFNNSSYYKTFLNCEK